MTFEEWRDKFQQKLKNGTPAFEAFQAWREHIEEFQKSAQAMPTWKHVRKSPVDSPFTADPKTYVLRSLYSETRPPSDEEACQRQKRRKDDEYTLTQLEALITQTENFLAHLRSRDPYVWSKDGCWGVNLSPLLGTYGDATDGARYALSLLRQKHTREPDIIDSCLGLYADLRNPYKFPKKEALIKGKTSAAENRVPRKREPAISETQVVALLELALWAHGINKQELGRLNPDFARDGKVRKRLHSRAADLIEVANKISARTRKY